MKNTWRKIGLWLLYPPIPLMILLVPVATVLLIYAMAVVGTESAAAYVAYVLSAYTLTIWCIRLPSLIRRAKRFKNENPYAVRWSEDVHWRVKTSLYGSCLWNTAYVSLQLGLAIRHRTFWYYSMAGYYLSLAIMRFFLARHTRRHSPGEEMRAELVRYRACGWIFLFMNLTLTVMVSIMIYQNRTFVHHEVTTIAMAAYTFTSFIISIINLVKFRKFSSPVYIAAKVISLTAACVSVLTLTNTMLAVFSSPGELFFRRLMLGLVGGAVSIFILTMSIYMIVHSTKQLKDYKKEVYHEP